MTVHWPPLFGDLAEPFAASGVERKHRVFVAEFPFCCWGEVVWSGEEDDVLAFGYLCAGVQDPVELFLVAGAVFVADVFCEDLWRDVLDVFSAVVDDGLGDAVLGLFTWNDDPAFAHREIDIEISRWGKSDNNDAQFVVQPSDRVGHIIRYSMVSGKNSMHSFAWSSRSADFESWAANRELIQQHIFSEGITW